MEYTQNLTTNIMTSQKDALLQSSLTAKIKDELVYTIQSKNANSGERCHEMNDSVKEMKDKGVSFQEKSDNKPCRECKKRFNKAITIALNKLRSKTARRAKKNQLKPVVIFNADDFWNFIEELRRCCE